MDSTSNVVADTICRTAELGLAITGAMDAGDFTFIEATATAFADTCNSCAMSGQFRDHAYRTLIDLPIVGFPTKLRIRLPRYRCTNDNCAVKYFQAQLVCADPGKKVTHRVTRWILQRLAIDRMSISATAKALGIGWDLTCQLALDMCHELIYNDPTHLD
ncbi:ISL3 family transposase, partial [Corynebacterium casei]